MALDLTLQMLKKAAQRCAALGRDNVSFREANAAELPFADGAFGAVVTRLSVHHFDHNLRGFTEQLLELFDGLNCIHFFSL